MLRSYIRQMVALYLDRRSRTNESNSLCSDLHDFINNAQMAHIISTEQCIAVPSGQTNNTKRPCRVDISSHVDILGNRL